MDLNEELAKFNEEEFALLINDAINSLNSTIKNLYICEGTRDDIVSIAHICMTFGIINSLKSSKTIDCELDQRKRVMLYTANWLKKLVAAHIQPTLLKEATPLRERDTIRDPALAHVLNRYYIENDMDVSTDDISLAIDSHDLLMSIENIQGHLLEAYIAKNLCQPPFNFIWLEGEIVRAADFAHYDASTNTLKLLQIKNKYNTENSSSVTVRDGKHVEIEKWYRLGKKKVNRLNVPDYKWHELNAKVEIVTGHSSELSEEDYLQFLSDTLHTNPKLISL